MTETSPRLSFATRLRNNFLAGLVICAPIAITIWLTWTFIRWADSWVKPYIPARYNPESYLNFAVPGFGLLIALIVITIIGFLGKNLIGRSIVDFGESIMDRMPLVRGLYRSLKQIFENGAEGPGYALQQGGADRISERGALVAGLHRHRRQGRGRLQIRRHGPRHGRLLHAADAGCRRPASSFSSSGKRSCRST